MNSKRLYKPIKCIKKMYNDVTGKFYLYNDLKYSFQKSSENKSTTEVGENLIIDEKTMKINKILNFSIYSHCFNVWKEQTKKNKKPKFYDIIIIMMKCLFTKNKMVKRAFMGEKFFIFGKNIFIWYWNTIGQRKKN